VLDADPEDDADAAVVDMDVDEVEDVIGTYCSSLRFGGVDLLRGGTLRRGALVVRNVFA
jgi:hypothetical protein